MRRPDHAACSGSATGSSSGSGSPAAAARSARPARLLTDEIKGKPVAEVAAFRADDLLDLLGIEISPARLKCAMLSHDSLQHVLDDLGARPPGATRAGGAGRGA